MSRVLWMVLALAAAVAPAAAAPVPAAGTLTAGDRLQIKVAGEPDLSKEYMVDEAGQITIELVGPIKAAGLTLPQFQASLDRSLARYIRKPVTTVVASQRVGVAGGVRVPGAYDFPKDHRIRLMDALTRAGGFAERARKKRVLVVRKAMGAAQPQTLLVDVEAFLKKGKPEQNPLLEPNDLVYVDVGDPRDRPRGIGGLLERALPFVAAFL